MTSAIFEPAVGNFRKELWLSDLSATRDDRIGKVLPHGRQEAPGDSVMLSLESDRPPKLNHRISATRKPIDLRHVVKFDCHRRFPGELKTFGSVPFERRCFGQKACRD